MDDFVAQARTYIQQQLASGQSADVVLQQLRAAGWQEDLIQQAFTALQTEVVPAELKPGDRIEPGQPVVMQTNVTEVAAPVQPTNEQPVMPAQPVEQPVQTPGPTQTQPSAPIADVTPPPTTATPVAQPQPVAPAVPIPNLQTQPIEQTMPLTGPQANGKRHGRFRTGWHLFTTSMAILNGNRYLLRYLLMMGIWIGVVTGIFVVIYSVLGDRIYELDREHEGIQNLVGYGLTFIDYLLVYFIINLYAAGLTANVFDIFAGNRQSYGEYMRLARKKIPALLAFSFVNATVGLLLRIVVERLRFGWVLSWIFGTAWSLGTSFTVPVIVATERPNGFKAIGQSFSFFKQNWGEGITTKASVNIPFGILQFALFGFAVAVVLATVTTVGLTGVFIVFIIYLILSLILAIIGAFANSLINIALFYYANYRQVPPAFGEELLNSIFIPRRRFFKKQPQPPVA